MSKLSPQAQAVVDAYYLTLDHEGPNVPETLLIAAALRAAAIHCGYRPPGTNDRIISDGELIAIAKELEGGHVD